MYFFPLSFRYCQDISDSKKDNCFLDGISLKKVMIGKPAANEVIGINNNSLQRISKLLITSDDWFLSQLAINNKQVK